MGLLTDGDIISMERGAKADASAGQVTDPRFGAVEISTLETSEEILIRLVRLLGSVGARHIELDSSPPTISCSTLLSILDSCPTTEKLTISDVQCDDIHLVLEQQWPAFNGQLRDLHTRIVNCDGPGVRECGTSGCLQASLGMREMD